MFSLTASIKQSLYKLKPPGVIPIDDEKYIKLKLDDIISNFDKEKDPSTPTKDNHVPSTLEIVKKYTLIKSASKTSI